MDSTCFRGFSIFFRVIDGNNIEKLKNLIHFFHGEGSEITLGSYAKFSSHFSHSLAILINFLNEKPFKKVNDSLVLHTPSPPAPIHNNKNHSPHSHQIYRSKSIQQLSNYKSIKELNFSAKFNDRLSIQLWKRKLEKLTVECWKIYVLINMLLEGDFSANFTFPKSLYKSSGGRIYKSINNERILMPVNFNLAVGTEKVSFDFPLNFSSIFLTTFWMTGVLELEKFKENWRKFMRRPKRRSTEMEENLTKI